MSNDKPKSAPTVYPRHYCEQCQRDVQYDAGRFLPHYNAKTAKPAKEKPVAKPDKPAKGNLKCQHCGALFLTAGRHVRHEQRCIINPNRIAD